MSTQHTPGPWSIYDYGEEEAPTLVIHKDSATRICFMATPGSHGDPAIIEANAHLIIAAPDMLAALKDIASGSLNATDAMLANRETLMSALATYCQDRARAAIRKATGAAP